MTMLRGKKGMAMIVVVLGMLIFGALGATFASFIAGDLAISTEGLQSAQAFYVAEGGMQYVQMNQLNGDNNFSDNTSPTDPPFGPSSINLSPGDFWIEYLNQQSDTVTVRVTARVGDSVRVIQQDVGQGGSGQQYVTLAGGNLNMNSSSGTLNGDVGITGVANLDEDVIVNGNITEDPTLELPTLDFDTYKNMCTSSYSGNKTISSNTTANLCVTGNVTIKANVTYTGLLYATGNVTINGNNVIINGSIVTERNMNGDNRTGLQFNAQTIDADTHMPAIASQGTFSLKNDDNMQINGVIWTSGTADLTNSDNLQYRGSFIVGGNMVINTASNVSITFDSDLTTGIPGLSGGPGDSAGSLSLSGWRTY